MDKDKLRTYLKVIKRAAALIEDIIDNADDRILEEVEGAAELFRDNKEPPKVRLEPESKPQLVDQMQSSEQYEEWRLKRKKHIRDLMGIDCWPEAVPAALMIGATDADQEKRSDAVLDMMLDRDISGLNFLDFGCGEGWITKHVLNRKVAEAVGYDIKKYDTWKTLGGKNTYTHIYNEIKRSHYDVILMYDVLDHCQNPEEAMKQVKNLLRKDGVIYVRCHPFTARHAAHVYKQGLNKAFIQLFLTAVELGEQVTEAPMFTRKELKPIEAYRQWFRDFDIVKERLIKAPVDEFFHVPAFKELLSNEQSLVQLGINVDDFLRVMEVNFIDYCLSPKC